jgi:hypothetical protein
MKDPLSNLDYNSETPTSTAEDVSTTISREDCECDPVATQIAMTVEQQLAFRMKAFNAAKPNTDTTLPHFQAGEIED